MTRIMGILQEDQYTFATTSRSVLPRIRNISEKLCIENHNTHFTFITTPPHPHPAPRCCAVYEIMWKNPAERGRPD